MLTAKSKSSLSNTHNGKNAQITPKSSLSVRGSTKSASGLPFLLQSSRSYDSRLTTEHRSSKMSSSADKLPRPTKTSELQSKLVAVQELNRTREQLAAVEQEKLKAVEELNDAKRTADENYYKLNEAIATLNKDEESLEIAKFRAVEIEQVGIEAAMKKEEECQKVLDSVRSKHELDALTFLSTTKELERVRQELTLASDSRDRAISHSNEVIKLAKINAEKVDTLSSEVSRLNAFLNSRMESLSKENQEIVRKLNLEIDCLKSKLEKTKLTDEKLVEVEVLLEVFNTEVNKVKSGEIEAGKFVDKFKKQVELLLVQLHETNLSEKSSSEFSDLVAKQLENCKAAFLDSESELAALREKVISLDFEVVQHNEDREGSERRFRAAQIEASEMAKKVDILKSKLQNLEQEKLHAIENEKIVASEIESLSEEKKKLNRELEVARDESENNKKAMEELASALRQVSLESREAREILLEKHTEIEDAYAQTEHFRSALKNTEETYQVMLDEARYEIICLKKYIERNQAEAESLKAGWNVKELNVKGSIENLTEEYESESLNDADCQADALKDDKFQMLNKVMEPESGGSAANGAAEEARVNPLSFKERLLELESELQTIKTENYDIPAREAAAIDKIKELSISLANAKVIKPKHSLLSNSDREYEFPDANAIHSERTKISPKLILGMQGYFAQVKDENANGIPNSKDDTLKIGTKLDFSAGEYDVESLDDELDYRMGSRSIRKVNVLSSEDVNVGPLSTIRIQEGKKKALLNKFGNLLKRSNHK